MSPPHNPHDRFVRRIFSDPAAAEEELRPLLSPPLRDRLNWPRLTLTSTSHIAPDLTARFSDLVYTIPQRAHGHAHVYVLFEHQSSPDPLMAARFLIYAGRVYEQYLRDNPNAAKVPLVVPLLLFHGPTGWSRARTLGELIDIEQPVGFERPIELHFPVDETHRELADPLTVRTVRSLRGFAKAQAARTLLWLYHRKPKHLGPRAAALAKWCRQIEQFDGPRALQPFFTYYVAVFESSSPIGDIMLKSTTPQARNLYTTIREELLAQGREEGHAAGREEGHAAGREEGHAAGREEGRKGEASMLLQLLTARGIEVDDALRERIEHDEDVGTIRAWFARAIHAGSLGDVFDPH